MTAPDPYEEINHAGASDILVLCDHASNVVPPDVAGGDLGLRATDMQRHIAYDIGARGVAAELARLLDAPAVLSRFSRLVVDPNRGEDDPTLIMRIYDSTVVPGNRRLGADERERRLARYHRPYHDAIDRRLDAMLAAGREPALVAIHSFTPQFLGRAPRPWHVGVLWHRDGRIAEPLIARLRREGDLCVGDNQPYAGQLEGDTLSRHGTGRGLRHVLIELRHDLIDAPEAQRLWAARLAPILTTIVGTDAHEEIRHG